MAGKFFELKEAADMLGVSPDELIELRASGDIHGYRDGASWKFKEDEIERFANEKGINVGGAPGSSIDLDDDLSDLSFRFTTRSQGIDFDKGRFLPCESTSPSERG